jgi:MFS transporter, FSR family, fosmidomycin resistance protein
LVDGAKGAALPLIRHDLGLSYAQVGLLASVPLLAGGALELPLGLLADGGRRRRLVVLAGGIVFTLSLTAVAGARSFAVLLAAFTAFYPASGAFVSLTQAELMDAWPDRQARVMARWDLAGSTGAVAGPLLVTAVIAARGGWRAAYLLLAALAAVAWIGTCLRDDHPARAEAGLATTVPAAADTAAADTAAAVTTADTATADTAAGDRAPDPALAARVREVLAALGRWRTVRWLVLLQVADLLVDVLTGFAALYLVDVARLSPAIAALGIAVRLGSALAGDALLVLVLDRVADLTVLRASAVAAGLLYPGFLLAPGPVAKLALLAVLSAATAPWYPLLQARLYGSLPGRSPVAVTLNSAAGVAGGLGPLAVGLIAGRFGLSWALAGLAVVPAAVLGGTVGAGAAGAGGADAEPVGGE